MKMTKILLLATLLFWTGFLYADDKPIQKHQLPKTSQKFIDQHFQGVEIAYCSKDDDSYEVKFLNGYELEFTRRGEWKSVDCQNNPIPDAIIPAQISQYIKKNFAQTFIVKIEKDPFGFEVELNNDWDLEFDRNGKLKEIDD